jgi:hypothetical protein
VRYAAIVAGLISALITWWVWGAANPIPVVSDEQSYVLQSKIFAAGHWTASTPAVPEAFEQSHVLVTPAVASKFPPGHALLLSIGTLLGSPAIASLLLTTITGWLLFLLVDRVGGPWVAPLTIAIWLSDPINLRFRPSYFSEITTQLLWLVSWWALLEWRDSRNSKWLLTLATAIGFGAITRPLTMLAFAIPVGVVVVRDVARLRLWRDFALACGVGVLILGVIPLWSVQTTGNWRVTPLTLYQRDYLPYDKPGFGLDTTPPTRPLNPVNAFTYSEYNREHAVHTPRNLPAIVYDRLRVIAISEWSGPRMVLVPFVVVGLFAMSGAVMLGLVCSIALFAAYLSYGHFSEWTLYYFEATPVLAVIGAIGFFVAVQRIGEPLLRGKTQRALMEMRPDGPPPTFELMVGRVPSGIIACVALGILASHEAKIWRVNHIENARWYSEFNQALTRLPKNPTIIFVHYGPRLQPHPNLVTNSPHLADEPIWIVNDVGDRDQDVMRIAGPRIPIAFYEDGRRFEVDRNLLGRR